MFLSSAQLYRYLSSKHLRLQSPQFELWSEQVVSSPAEHPREEAYVV